MAEELQHLIDRIQKEAIGNAEAEAGRIVSQAREKAAGIVKDAEAKASARFEKADRDAQVFVERGARTLEQAARDLLITVGQGVENILKDIVDESVEKAMDISVLEQMLLRIAEAYVAKDGAESRIEFLIGEEDQSEIIRFFADQYRQHLIKGVHIHTDNGILKGFRVTIRGDHVYHDFTKAAIAEALSNFLRGHLSEIVHRAAREAADGGAPGDERPPPTGGKE